MTTESVTAELNHLLNWGYKVREVNLFDANGFQPYAAEVLLGIRRKLYPAAIIAHSRNGNANESFVSELMQLAAEVGVGDQQPVDNNLQTVLEMLQRIGRAISETASPPAAKRAGHAPQLQQHAETMQRLWTIRELVMKHVDTDSLPRLAAASPLMFGSTALKQLMEDVPYKRNEFTAAVLHTWLQSHPTDSMPTEKYLWIDEWRLRSKTRDFLRFATERGYTDIVQHLLRAPYGLGAADCRYTLRVACENGRSEIVKMLTEPPFLLNGGDARSDNNFALHMACNYGHAEIVKMLGAPPFSLNGQDARTSSNYALRSACQKGHVEVLKLLRAPPFSLGQDDARALDNYALRMACLNGHAEIVKMLGAPPFSLNGQDARASSNCALRRACQKGHVEVLKLLGAPPFSLGQDDARALDNCALRMACLYGHAEVVKLLAAPPFSLAQQDASARSLRQALEFGYADVVNLLIAPPFNLTLP